MSSKNRKAPVKEELIPKGVPGIARADPPRPRREPIVLSKGRHRWFFNCDAGAEQQLIESVGACARRGDTPLDEFDAALICQQIRKRLMGAAPKQRPEQAPEQT